MAVDLLGMQIECRGDDKHPFAPGDRAVFERSGHGAVALKVAAEDTSVVPNRQPGKGEDVHAILDRLDTAVTKHKLTDARVPAAPAPFAQSALSNLCQGEISGIRRGRGLIGIIVV